MGKHAGGATHAKMEMNDFHFAEIKFAKCSPLKKRKPYLLQDVVKGKYHVNFIL